ncbi:hypothetical protein KR038_008748, partial [Drosophila bunnanda]
NILRKKQVFSHSNEALPFNTSMVDTIRTETNEPVYSKLYLYPMGEADFVNTEIKQLLKNGIIRPSRSPFNSPTWVVDKKGLDADGNKKKRLGIDFKKLNERTIADRYPMPSIAMILANLGKAKFFTALDLKSGYHQINLADKRRKESNNPGGSRAAFTATIHSFRDQNRHIIQFNDKDWLFGLVKEVVNVDVVNAIYCDLPVLARIQHALVTEFPVIKFWHC